MAVGYLTFTLYLQRLQTRGQARYIPYLSKKAFLQHHFPTLGVDPNEQGNPSLNPDNPNAFLPNFIPNITGTMLPSIGVIVELYTLLMRWF